jgi:hypothetical protein
LPIKNMMPPAVARSSPASGVGVSLTLSPAQISMQHGLLTGMGRLAIEKCDGLAS